MFGAPGSASAIATPVAAPRPARFVAVIVQVAGAPAAMKGVDVDLATVICGKQAVVEPAPGICPAARVAIWKPPTDDEEP
ncbi:MAG: hypothetical protein IPJ28_18430 [Betaproteobacteria bacterium]|nr:hypothetical protein [Betaproteobacteria bacterium]